MFFTYVDGEKIRELRVKLKVTKRSLAERTDLSMRTLSRMEQGGMVGSHNLRKVAEALGVDLASLMLSKPSVKHVYQSVFISYGGPDSEFARKLYESLLSHGVEVFFFPESAVPGKRLHRTMAQAVHEFDRVILICSKNSLDRPGVSNEIEEILTREAMEGGTELIIPIILDDYLFTNWTPMKMDVGFQIRSRVAADFRGAEDNGSVFEKCLAKLLRALESPA